MLAEMKAKASKSKNLDFEKMSMIDSFKDYINNEIPKYDPKWLTDQYMVDVEQKMFNKIRDNLEKVEISTKAQKTTMQLPNLSEQVEQMVKDNSMIHPRKETKGGFPRQSMRLLANTQIGLQQNENVNVEYLDKQQLETDLYKGLKKDIDKILLKAWEG